MMLNKVAKSVVDAQRGNHPSRVFTYRGRPITGIYNSAWKRARVEAAEAYAKARGEPVIWGFANLRVHDLKHTFGRRLRAAGVPLETRKVLLGHRNGDITTHYSAPEIEELLESVNRVCESRSRKNPAGYENELVIVASCVFNRSIMAFLYDFMGFSARCPSPQKAV